MYVFVRKGYYERSQFITRSERKVICESITIKGIYESICISGISVCVARRLSHGQMAKSLFRVYTCTLSVHVRNGEI